MYLLDTMVLSELRKTRLDSGLLNWVRPVPTVDLFVSTISLGEIELGVERQRSRNPAFAAELGEWLDVTIRAYGDRILPFGVTEALRWGKLAARIGHKGLDLAIAATALEHGLTVVTRNVAHFAPTGVATLNPFSGRQ